MTAIEWASLFLALSTLAFVFVWTLLIAGKAEQRRLDEAARRRYIQRGQQ